MGTKNRTYHISGGKQVKTHFDEYEKIRDKAAIYTIDEWKGMDPEERARILSGKTVLTQGSVGPTYKIFYIKGNVNRLKDEECAIIADRGNLCFGYRREGNKIIVYTD